LHGRGQSRCLCARGRQSADQNTRLTALPMQGRLAGVRAVMEAHSARIA